MTAPALFPFEPLAAAAGVTLGQIGGQTRTGDHDPRNGYAELEVLLGASRTTLRRWRQRGLTVDQADDLAGKLGLLPHEVWPDWYRIIALPPAGAVNAVKTHCPQGHPYSGLDSRGYRICTPCKVAKVYEIRANTQPTQLATPRQEELFAC